jgi:hypothetical protein
MLDGMSIRKHIDWDPKRKEMVGFVDLGLWTGRPERPL